MTWAWWMGAALLLAVIEMLSLDLVLIMFAGGAFVAGLLALAGFDVWVQFVGFAVTSVVLLAALRPWLLRHLRTRVPLVETNAAALVGRPAVVVAQVTQRAGRVKLAGEVWTARTDGDEVVAAGEDVRVVRITGATAVVTAAASTPDGQPSRPQDRPQESTS
ncbi:MAG TPA: NfeD family protein [Actinotalea sp.]|nr:NfeD family protein [Actinotalea sp.]